MLCQSKHIVSALVVAVVFCSAARARAVLVAEMGFRYVNTAPDPDRTAITNNKAGSSYKAELVVDAGTAVNINTGSTGLGEEFITNLQSGYLNAPATNSGGVISIDTSGSNGTLDNYITATAGMGQGTVYGIYRPNFNGTTGRNSIFSHQVQNANQIWLYAGEAGNNLSFRLNDATSSSTTLGSYSFSWDSSKWYMVGASWEDTLVSGSTVNRGMKLYLRELDESMPAALTNSLAQNGITQGLLSGANWYVGRRSNNATEAARGDIALFRMFDEAFSLADFDTAYQELFVVPTPEPATGLSLALAALQLGILMRSRPGRKLRG